MYKFLIACCLLTACSAPPSVPICVELSLTKAYCRYTIEDKEFIWSEENKYEGKTWWESRSKLLLVPPSSWAEIKAYIIKNCKQTNKCGNITSWDRTIEAFDAKLNGL